MLNRVLLNFSLTNFDDIEKKGNANYLKGYLSYFQRMVSVYVWGSRNREVESEGLTLVCVAKGQPRFDLMLSPWRVYREARRRSATHFLTADLVYGWWHSILIRTVLRAKVVVMPVCTPPEIFKNTGRTYSGYAPWCEKLLITLTLAAAHRILVCQSTPADQKWIGGLWCHRKMIIAKATPEELSAPEFYQELDILGAATGAARVRKSDDPIRLVHVGRLEREKHVDQLVEVANKLAQLGLDFSLVMIGDGSERQTLEARIAELNLAEKAIILGFRSPAEIARELAKSDIFVSPMTGTALKEAAIARLAVVASRRIAVPATFVDGENCLLPQADNVDEMAEKILSLSRNQRLRVELGHRAREATLAVWSPETAGDGLEQAFGDL